MMYRLILLTGPSKGQQTTVETAPMTLGGDPDCSIRLQDDEVARKHAILEHKTDGLFIRDLGSMNKVLVNNREVHETRLKHGDVIELGRTRFLVQALVQAEITEETARAVRRRDLASLATVIGLFLLVSFVATVVIWRRFTRIPPPRALQAATSQPPAVAAAKHTGKKAAPTARVTVATGAVSETASPVTEEIRRMREDLADIRESVRGLAVQQPATSATAAAATEQDAATKMALRQKIEGMMEASARDVSANNLLAADQLLESVQIVDPGYAPAYEQRAKLFEQRGMLDEAIEQWSQIIRRSQGTPLYVRAVSERLRLSQAKATGLRHVRIASVEQQKFPVTDTYDEMRILNIALATGLPEQAIEADAVRIEVSFFDEDAKTRVVHSTRAVAPREPLKPDGKWAPNEQKVVSATYLVPKDFRTREAQLGRQDRFYGYVVRVFYHGRMQDQDARPKTLLERAPRTTVAGPGTNQPPRAVARGGAS
ncbi:MAG: FHA domain-containing protein [Verrucomicrobiota bacterium]